MEREPSLKLTKHRKSILEVLKNEHQALSAKEINLLLPNIDKATIHRTLNLFVENKMIKELRHSRLESKFEINDDKHDHAYCNDCGKILHIKLDKQELIDSLKIKDFKVDDIEVSINGSCDKKHKKDIKLVTE